MENQEVNQEMLNQMVAEARKNAKLPVEQEKKPATWWSKTLGFIKKNWAYAAAAVGGAAVGMGIDRLLLNHDNDNNHDHDYSDPIVTDFVDENDED